MAINFKGDIEAIRNNYARIRTVDAYSPPIVAAEVTQYTDTLNAALANLGSAKPSVAETAAGSTTFASAQITMADKSIARLFAVATPDRGPARG